MPPSIEPPRTVTVPSKLLDGRYTVQRTLGTDVDGSVVLATETRTNASVAIQYLPAAEPEYDRRLERFQHMVAVSRLVRHPNIVVMQDVLVDDEKNACLVMEFVDGPPLRGVLASASVRSAERALAIALDVAHALQALHEHDIVHQDLSPAHILLAKGGAAKVTGFGDAQIGRASSFVHLGGERPGTPGYMSPEQESGLGGIDGRSDLYSLGAILYEMLAGEPYIRTGRSLTIVRPDLPPATVMLVSRLLERQAAFRYATADEVARDLDGLLHPESPRTEVSPQVQGGALADLSPTVTPPPLVPPMTTPSLAAGEALPAPSSVSFDVPPTAPPMTHFDPVRSAPSATAPAAPPPARLPVRPGTTESEKPIFHPLPTYSDAASPAIPTRRDATGQSFKGSWIGVLAVIMAILVLRSAFSRTATPRVAPTRTPISATRTALPATGTTAAQPTLWTDPKGRINLQLPSGWHAIPPGSNAKPTDVVTLLGPTATFFIIQMYTPTDTIDGEFTSLRRNQATVTNRTFTQGQVTNVTIGGEQGKYMEFRAVYAATYTSSSSSTAYAPYAGVEWLVDHGGKRFSFLTADVTRRADYDAIIASVIFPK